MWVKQCHKHQEWLVEASRHQKILDYRNQETADSSNNNGGKTIIYNNNKPPHDREWYGMAPIYKNGGDWGMVYGIG